MRTSINSVSVKGKPNPQALSLNGHKLNFSGVRTALATLVSAVALSGCLLEGDVSGTDARNELMAQLESTGSVVDSSGREVGESGGTGVATSGSSGGSTAVPSTGALTNPDAIADHYPGTHNYSKTVDIPSCDSSDALRISTVAGLSQINSTDYRVFCIAPGDYRSAGTIYLPEGGTESAPRVIRFESSQFDDDDEIFTSNTSDLALMPGIKLSYKSNWVLHRLAFVGLSSGTMPIRLTGSTNIVVDRVRLENNYKGIEFRDGSHDSYVQNSYIADQVVPQGSGNDGVCVAFMGNFRENPNGSIDYNVNSSMKNNFVVNNEIVNCNDGIQIVWMHYYTNFPNLEGTTFAGNDIYLTDDVRTNCYGSLDPNGNCTYLENPIDLKGGSLNPDNPLRIFDNRMWGYGKTDSSYNPPANSWGSGISAHYRSVQNLEIYENVIWDVPSGIALVRGVSNTVVRDNIIAHINQTPGNNGIALVASTDSGEMVSTAALTRNPSSYSAYGNNKYLGVSDVTIENNHIVVAQNPTSGAAWLSTNSLNSDFTCNVVANGNWTSGNFTGSGTGQNTYYDTNSGSLSRGSDAVFSSFGSANMGRLCFDTKKASIPGGERVCLDNVLQSDSSPSQCGSDYWSTDLWPSS